jgi:hypothetical protein
MFLPVCAYELLCVNGLSLIISVISSCGLDLYNIYVFELRYYVFKYSCVNVVMNIWVHKWQGISWLASFLRKVFALWIVLVLLQSLNSYSEEVVDVDMNKQCKWYLSLYINDFQQYFFL